MSLDVPAELLAAAEVGEVGDEQFADCIRTSLPYAWRMVNQLSTRLLVEGNKGSPTEGGEPPSERSARRNGGRRAGKSREDDGGGPRAGRAGRLRRRPARPSSMCRRVSSLTCTGGCARWRKAPPLDIL